VTILTLGRWVVLGLLRSPATCALALALVAAVPLASAIQPLPGPHGNLDVVMAWAFPTGLLGTLLGLLVLVRGRAFLARLSPGTRWGGELVGLGAAALIMQLPILGGALLTGAGPADLASSLPAILSADLHLAAIALVLLQPALDRTLTACAFLACAWLLPALVAADEPLRRIAGLLDAGRALRADDLAAPVATGACIAAASLLLRIAPTRPA
jgi:hypothetical protein